MSRYEIDPVEASFAVHGVLAQQLGHQTPVAALRTLKMVQEDVERLRRAAVRDARLAGVTWDHVGEALGVTKQAAQGRYGISCSGASSSSGQDGRHQG